MVSFQCSEDFILVDDFDYKVPDEEVSKIIRKIGVLYAVGLSGKIDYQEKTIKDVTWWESSFNFLTGGITSEDIEILSLSHIIFNSYIFATNFFFDYFKIFFSSRKEILLELLKRSPDSFDMPFENEILRSPGRGGVYTYFYVDKHDIRYVSKNN